MILKMYEYEVKAITQPVAFGALLLHKPEIRISNFFKYFKAIASGSNYLRYYPRLSILLV